MLGLSEDVTVVENTLKSRRCLLKDYANLWSKLKDSERILIKLKKNAEEMNDGYVQLNAQLKILQAQEAAEIELKVKEKLKIQKVVDNQKEELHQQSESCQMLNHKIARLPVCSFKTDGSGEHKAQDVSIADIKCLLKELNMQYSKLMQSSELELTAIERETENIKHFQEMLRFQNDHSSREVFIPSVEQVTVDSYRTKDYKCTVVTDLVPFLSTDILLFLIEITDSIILFACRWWMRTIYVHFNWAEKITDWIIRGLEKENCYENHIIWGFFNMCKSLLMIFVLQYIFVPFLWLGFAFMKIITIFTLILFTVMMLLALKKKQDSVAVFILDVGLFSILYMHVVIEYFIECCSIVPLLCCDILRSIGLRQFLTEWKFETSTLGKNLLEICIAPKVYLIENTKTLSPLQFNIDEKLFEINQKIRRSVRYVTNKLRW